jgi:hypothetical protein
MSMKLIIENGVYSIVESPDKIMVALSGGRSKLMYTYNKGDTFAFGIDKKTGEMLIGNRQKTHYDIGGRAALKYPGRYWAARKVISFWTYPPRNKLLSIIKSINDAHNHVRQDGFGTTFKSRDKDDEAEMEKWELEQHLEGWVTRAEKWGPINIDDSWRIEIPSKEGERYTQFTKRTGEMNQGDFAISPSHLYKVKTVMSNKKLKGVGEDWKKSGDKAISVDKGQEHLAPALLKKNAIQKMGKRQRAELWGYLKAKGRLNPAEKRMYNMISRNGRIKEDIEIHFDGARLIVLENPEWAVVDGQAAKYGHGDAVPFGKDKKTGKYVFGDYMDTHGDIVLNNSEVKYARRGDLEYAGRMWMKRKLISFWTYPPLNKLKSELKDIQKAWKDNDRAKHSFNYMSFSIELPPSDKDLNARGAWDEEAVLVADVLKGNKYYPKVSVNVDTGKEHVASAMLKKGAYSKLDKKQKTAVYNYFKEKGRLSPAEKRMYKMIQREGIDIYFNGKTFMFEETMLSEGVIDDELKTFDSEQVSMGKKVEGEHDNGDDVDIVKSEEDLMKVILAHLREDPKYYTKLKKVEETYEKHLTFVTEDGILLEAPHIVVGDKAIDFEFEKDKVAGLKKIIKAIMREEVTDKHGSIFKLSSGSEVNDFIKKIMKNPQVRRLLQ